MSNNFAAFSSTPDWSEEETSSLSEEDSQSLEKEEGDEEPDEEESDEEDGEEEPEAKKYAGKFLSVEELEKGYKELEKKLRSRGSSKDSQQSKDSDSEDGDQATAGSQVVLSADEISELTAFAGGEKQISKMLAWAEKTLSAQEVAQYNAAVNSNSAIAVKGGLAWLQAQYESRQGERGTLRGGKLSQRTDVYESAEQMVADMMDPRYASDPAFVRKVEAKAARSPIFR